MDTSGNTFVRGCLQGNPTASGAGTPVNALAYNVCGYGAVINAAGNWVGKPIASGQSQSPWTQHIQGAGFALLNTGTVQSGQFILNSGKVVIDGNGAFVGNGIDVGSQGIGCSYLSTTGRGNPNKVDTGTLNAATLVDCAGTIHSTGGYTGGAFTGGGVSVGANGISCGALSTFGVTPNTPNGIDTQTINAAGNVNVSGNVNSNGGYIGGSFRGAGGVDVGGAGIAGGSLTIRGPDVGVNPACNVNGTVNCTRLLIGGTQRINTAGIYCGGLQFLDHVYAQDFGIYNYSRGWNGGFYDRDNNYHVVNGGILINNPPSASQAQTTVVCDQCGSWDITYRRKNPLPPAQLKLSEAVLEFEQAQGRAGAFAGGRDGGRMPGLRVHGGVQQDGECQLGESNGKDVSIGSEGTGRAATGGPGEDDGPRAGWGAQFGHGDGQKESGRGAGAAEVPHSPGRHRARHRAV